MSEVRKCLECSAPLLSGQAKYCSPRCSATGQHKMVDEPPPTGNEWPEWMAIEKPFARHNLELVSYGQRISRPDQPRSMTGCSAEMTAQ